MSKLENILVDEYTSPIQYFATPKTTLGEMKYQLKEFGFRHIPVVLDNKAVGIVSDRDIALASTFGPDDTVVAADIMATNLFTARMGTPIEDVVFELSNLKIGSAIILNEKGEAEGIFTSTDALNALIEIVRGY